MNINRTIDRLATRESFSPKEPIRNPNAKGKDTSGMVSVRLKDSHNTIIFCETPEEAERVTPQYEKRIADFANGKDREGGYRTEFSNKKVKAKK